MNDWFSWNGKKCTEYGIHVLEQPPITIPAERATFTNIPGRPGSLTTLEGDDVYDDLILTAQCIRNGCELFGQTPHETFANFGYAAMSYANPRSKKAVSDVFDKGLKCVEDDIYCYYNSTMVASAWHETQTLSIDIDGNRFFY